MLFTDIFYTNLKKVLVQASILGSILVIATLLALITPTQIDYKTSTAGTNYSCPAGTTLNGINCEGLTCQDGSQAVSGNCNLNQLGLFHCNGTGTQVLPWLGKSALYKNGLCTTRPDLFITGSCPNSKTQLTQAFWAQAVNTISPSNFGLSDGPAPVVGEIISTMWGKARLSLGNDRTLPGGGVGYESVVQNWTDDDLQNNMCASAKVISVNTTSTGGSTSGGTTTIPTFERLANRRACPAGFGVLLIPTSTTHDVYPDLFYPAIPLVLCAKYNVKGIKGLAYGIPSASYRSMTCDSIGQTEIFATTLADGNYVASSLCGASTPQPLASVGMITTTPATANSYFCSAGQYLSNPNSDSCVICPANSYCTGGTGAVATPCPNSGLSIAGSTNINACVIANSSSTTSSMISSTINSSTVFSVQNSSSNSSQNSSLVSSAQSSNAVQSSQNSSIISSQTSSVISSINSQLSSQISSQNTISSIISNTNSSSQVSAPIIPTMALSSVEFANLTTVNCNGGRATTPNSTTFCSFNLPLNRTLPNDLVMAVGNINPAGSCTVFGELVTCVNVPVSSQSGSQNIFGAIAGIKSQVVGRFVFSGDSVVRTMTISNVLNTTVAIGGFVPSSSVFSSVSATANNIAFAQPITSNISQNLEGEYQPNNSITPNMPITSTNSNLKGIKTVRTGGFNVGSFLLTIAIGYSLVFGYYLNKNKNLRFGC